MPSPKISIAVPTFNRSKYLIRAVESALGQTYENLEVVISDDDSTDDTADVIRSFTDARVIALRQAKNVGLAGNWNAALHAASGELYIMLNDDDVLVPRALELLSRPFIYGIEGVLPEEIGVVWSPATIIDSGADRKYVTAAGPTQEPGWALVEGLFRGTRGPRFCSVMIRRLDALAVGGYHAEHGPIPDVGNWTQVAVSRPIAVCLPEPLASYTVHHASISSQARGALWQRSGEKITADLVALLEQRGEPRTARRIQAAGNDNTSNLLASVMMQTMGKPGWIKYWVSEIIRAPRYLLAPVVFKRLFRDGWKLLRLRSQARHGHKGRTPVTDPRREGETY